MTTEQLKKDIEFAESIAGQNLLFRSTWGLFSPRTIDEGTILLAKYLDIQPNDVCLDLGCGYGPLGLALAKLAPKGTVHMIDKDFVAVKYANLNISLNDIKNAKSYLSNGFDQIPSTQKFNVIVSNVPAKIGSELLAIFLHDAYNRLNPNGRLYIVTISGLKDYMKRNLNEVFGNYTKLKQSKTYTAASAVKAISSTLDA
jgi:16S rRNA (guanine1207-N2)-methyltransferase